MMYKAIQVKIGTELLTELEKRHYDGWELMFTPTVIGGSVVLLWYKPKIELEFESISEEDAANIVPENHNLEDEALLLSSE